MIGLSGATIDAGEAERIRELDPAGLILFLCSFTLVAMTAAALRFTKRLD